MISWIVATHNLNTLAENFGTLVDPADELLIEFKAPSIAAAYNNGQARAQFPVRVFVHHDVRLLNRSRLRELLVESCTPERGIVGVIGGTEHVVPWWNAPRVGSVIDARLGSIGPGAGGPCAVLDGLLLATRHELAWDETYTGWHMYDADMCRQQTELGRQNWCIDNGRDLVIHNTTGPRAVDAIDGWAAAVKVYEEKWS